MREWKGRIEREIKLETEREGKGDVEMSIMLFIKNVKKMLMGLSVSLNSFRTQIA